MGKQLNTIQSLANKSALYWASMRTNLQLAIRANIDQITIDNIRQELSDILDSSILTYPSTLSQLGLDPDQSLIDRKKEFGIPLEGFETTQNEDRFIQSMAFKAANMKKANWAWRIGQESKEKHSLGWFPFFVTLTVDPSQTDPKELWQKGRAFRKYIRRLSNVVCKELGHPPAHKKPYRPESEYVTYAGVIEHGKSREHHHGHFIIWLRTIPASWRSDPNAGIRNPANRTKNECLPMRTLWKHSLPGLSPALYFRSIGDIWEKGCKFMLPLKKGQPMRVSTAMAAGTYITKYLSKEHKEWNHRMKATRNLGLSKLLELVAGLPLETVGALTWRPKTSQLNHSLMLTHGIPQGLLRSVAKRQNYLIKYRRGLLDLTTLLQSNSQLFNKMLTSVRDGARPDRMPSSEFYDWVGRLLPAQRGYSEERLIEVHKIFSYGFPHTIEKTQHKKLGGNEIGHS